LYKQCFEAHGILPDDIKRMELPDLFAILKTKKTLSRAEIMAHVKEHREKAAAEAK
jgi:hypothetical protein